MVNTIPLQLHLILFHLQMHFVISRCSIGILLTILQIMYKYNAFIVVHHWKNVIAILKKYAMIVHVPCPRFLSLKVWSAYYTWELNINFFIWIALFFICIAVFFICIVLFFICIVLFFICIVLFFICIVLFFICIVLFLYA